MPASRSPLAQANLTALQALSASIIAGAAVFREDLADPENQTEDALTGNEFLGFLRCIITCCGLWRATAEQLVTQQPEYQDWLKVRDLAGDLKPGLND